MIPSTGELVDSSELEAWLGPTPTLKAFEKHVHADDVEEVRRAFAELAVKPLVTVPLLRVTQPDGSVHRYTLMARVEHRDEARERARVMLLDASHLATTHERLSRVSSRASLQLFQEASDGIFVIDERLMLVEANAAFATLLGTQRERLLQTSYADLTPPGDPPQVWELENGKGVVRQRSLKRADGTLVSVELSKRKLPDGTVLIVARDLAPRRQFESKIILTDRLSSLGTLAAGVAHELNNPLSWILSNLSQAQELLTVDQADREVELKELISDSLDGAHRIVTIVSDLKTFSRPDAPARRVSIHRVIERTVQMLAHQAKYRGRLITKLEPVPDVISRELQLSQVFINLLMNAVQALPEGHPEQHEVTVRAFTGSGGTAVIEVKDTGAGISAENLSKIFDPFFTTKPVGVGTGLGLTVVYNIVSSLGGKLEVHSVLGSGTTFSVILPPAPPDAPEPA